MRDSIIQHSERVFEWIFGSVLLELAPPSPRMVDHLTGDAVVGDFAEDRELEF